MIKMTFEEAIKKLEHMHDECINIMIRSKSESGRKHNYENAEAIKIALAYMEKHKDDGSNN